jgi:hypothetical protein
MAGTLAAAGGAAIGATIGKGIEKTVGYFQKKKQDKAYNNLKQQQQGVAEGEDEGIVINGKEVDKASLEVDGVDSRDYPDFSDAYFSAGSFTDGTPLSDEEIDQLSDQYGDLLYDKAYDSLHEGNTLLARIKSLALIK